MRLSGLVFSAILLVSATLFAQHTSAGGGSASFGGSSGSAASHGSYSGGSSSSASSASSHSSSSSSASHLASTSATSPHSSPSSKLSSSKGNASPEKKSSRSSFHPFRKPKPVESAEFRRPVPCLRGPCTVCPPGESRSGKGACVVTTSVCPSAQSWNGACGFPYGFNDCSALAERLAAERRHMLGQSDPGQALLYRLLLQQYESCVARYGSHVYSSAFMFDSLLNTP
jgi:hypothetical protein